MADATNHTDQEAAVDGAKKEEEQYADVDSPADRSDASNDGKKKKKKSKVATLWAKLDLDVGTVLMMMKAALPPAIALAMYQADDVAKQFGTLGYLTAIISILGFCIMPRAKFIQTMIMNVIGTCLGSAIGLLMLWTGVKAHQHSTLAGSTLQRYNSSQSVVLGVWLFFQIYIVNALKAKFPQLAFPVILYSILVNVAAVSGVNLQTTAQAENFIRRLLETFLTGFAIATGVSLVIVPVTCRTVVTKQATGYIMALRGALGAHKNYFQSLEHTDMFRQQTYVRDEEGNRKKNKEFRMKMKPEVEAVKKLTATFTELHGKLHGDIPFAKRELAYGKLTPDDFEAMSKHLRAIMMPMVGLSSLVDLFERASEVNHWDDQDRDVQEGLRAQTVAEWNELMQYVHEPFAAIIQDMDDGLEHVLLRLQFKKLLKKKKGTNQIDPEAKGDIVKPGDEEFAKHLENKLDTFYCGKQRTLRHWMESKGIKVPDNFFKHRTDDGNLCLQPVITRERNQRQLYTILYVIFLLNSVGRGVLEFVKFSDDKDQALAKSKLIIPNKKRFHKWIASIFKPQDSNDNDETTIAGVESGDFTIYMGSAYNSKKDPEHLPPVNTWEKFGNFLRGITAFLRSPESAFGFRCACATISIAIIAFLRHTQAFFVKQRLIWAMIMVAISMVPTSGQSIFTFVLRILGTLIAMIVAWLIWYIPGQHTAGIIVFLWFFVALGFYVPLKRMDLVIVGLISVVTATMIVGYELEVRKIGIQAASSNGQPFYPIYELGPYRLATVVGGLAVAFFWTFFPYPITEHSALRQKLGGTLYLAANLYSIMHETVKGRIRGDIGDDSDKTSPGHKLTKARNKVFAKQMLALQGLRMHAKMVKWEFPLGGKFPRKEYENIIDLVTNITNYTALLGFSSATFLDPTFTNNDDESLTQWFRDFREIVGSANVTSHEVTSILSLLSSAIINGQPLPPYLRAPSSFALSQKIEIVDHDILSLKHIAEPGYAAFAVVQISTRCIHMDVERLLVAVKKLVGELDFSFHVVSTQTPSSVSSSDTLVRTGSGRNKQD